MAGAAEAPPPAIRRPRRGAASANPSGSLRARPVFFVGFMGAGKTSVSRRLARLCGIASIDMDSYIERREGRRIRDIFAEDGEDGFRDHRDAGAARDDAGRPRAGVVRRRRGAARPRTARSCARPASSCILKVTADEAKSRISDPSTRPLFQDLGGGAQDRREERLPLYEEVADPPSTPPARVPAIAREVQRSLEKEGILCPQRK